MSQRRSKRFTNSHPRRACALVAFSIDALLRRARPLFAALLATLTLCAQPALCKALLGEPVVDRPSDGYDNQWCPAEANVAYNGTFVADGPQATFVFVATNHWPAGGQWRRERIDNVIVLPKAYRDAHVHAPDSALALAYPCIDPFKSYFHFNEVSPSDIVFFEKFDSPPGPAWDMTDGAYSEPATSALNTLTMPINQTGGCLGIGEDATPTTQATTEVTISGLTAGTQYHVSCWTRCISPSTGQDVHIQVYGTEFFSLVTETIGEASNTNGCSWGDYDNDGDHDLYLVNTSSTNQLWRNDGGNFFSDVTASSLAGYSGLSTCSAWGDADNDGDLDLYVGTDTSNRILWNRGNGTFTKDVSIPWNDNRGTRSMDWGDYDNDGDLDLFLANNGIDGLFRNDGGNFTDVAEFDVKGSGAAVGCSFVDYDNDDDLDLFVTYSNQNNELLKNDGGVFFESTPAVLATPKNQSRAAWADYDNDGDLDCYITSFGTGNRLCRNDGGGVFVDATPFLLSDGTFCVEAIWGDWDNDGRLDLYLIREALPNRLFRSLGSGAFAVQNTGMVEYSGIARGTAWADSDDDGDLDLYVANFATDRYFENEFGHTRNWIQIDLQGTTSNRFGVGAKIFVTTTSPTFSSTQMREVGGESGGRSQNSLTAEFGVGTVSSVTKIEVVWPTGNSQILKNVAANQRLTIVEGVTDSPVVAAGSAKDAALALLPNRPNPFAKGTSIVYSVPEASEGAIQIYDISGRRVRVLTSGMLPAGEHQVRWDGLDDRARVVPPGIYFCELRAGEERVTRKLVKTDGD